MIDSNEINSIISDIEETKKYLDDISNNIVTETTSKLDDIMNEIFVNIIDVKDAPINLVEHYFALLSNMLYTVSAKVEEMGMYDSISKIKYKEEYNNAFLNNDVKNADGKSPTATKLTSIAENSSKYENMLSDMYNRTYKILKAKIDAAETMVSTLSKIMSYRISENQYTDRTPEGKQILNEVF